MSKLTEIIATKTRSSDEQVQIAGSSAGRSAVILGTGIALVVIAVFSLVPTFDFVRFDDPLHLWQNPYVMGRSVAQIAHLWTHPYLQLYIPLSYMLFAFLASLAQLPANTSVSDIGCPLNPHVFHVASVILHTANVLLVFSLLRRLIKADWPSAAGALLFGMHPIQVESVAWISEMRGLLGAFFALLSINTYVASAAQGCKLSPSALIFFLLALFSKPSVSTVPLVMLILDRWIVGRDWNTVIRGIVPYLLTAIPFVFISGSVQGVPSSILAPVWTRPLIALDSVNFYLDKLVLPVDLGYDCGRSPRFLLAHHYLYYTWILPCVVAAAAWVFRKSFPALAISFALLFAAVLPSSGIVPFQFQHISTTADRYFYIPMLGPAFLAASIMKKYPRRILNLVAIIALITLGSLSAIQSMAWVNTIAVCENGIAVNPLSELLYNDLGECYQDRKMYSQAMQAYRKAITLNGEDYRPHENLAILLYQLGKTSDALPEIMIANQLLPGNTTVLFNIARMQSQLEQNRQAADTFNDLGAILTSRHEYARASDAFRRASALELK